MQGRVVFLTLLVFVAVVAATWPNNPGYTVPACGVNRTYNGECNNPIHQNYGKTHNLLKRGAEGVHFVDGVREPVVLPNMRTVSNRLFRADDAKLQEDGLNLYWTFFGQFIAHDLLGVNRKGDNGVDQTQPITNASVWLKVPLEDANDYFRTVATPPIAVDYIRVLRSRGQMVNGVFEVGSDSTSFFDLDTVYGKEEVVALKLRKFSGGELKSRVYNNYTAIQGPGFFHPGATTISANLTGNFGEWLPLIKDCDPTYEHVPISQQLTPSFTLNISERFFASGDGRNGENYWLNNIHGLFLREHNRIARKTALKNPSWNDEKIFQFARNLNIAQYQAILMYEYLPSLLKADYNSEIDDYEEFDPWVDPQSSQLFAFAFRFGHTTVPNALSLRNKCGNPAYNSSRDGPRAGQMASIFMPADQMAENGTPENVLHALLFQGARAIDFQFPESLRSIGFGANVDVVVQNQMRAADNGIPDYNTIRKLWYGGKTANIYKDKDCKTSNEFSDAEDTLECWKVFTKNTTAAIRLKELYGKVNKLNFYTSVVGEEPTKSVVGQTSARIIADQFRRSRDGDRWWFENEDNGLFTRAEIRKIKRETTIQDLIMRNFPNANVPEKAFYVPKPRFFRNCNP